jgi:hypothetical protein
MGFGSAEFLILKKIKLILVVLFLGLRCSSLFGFERWLKTALLVF